MKEDTMATVPQKCPVALGNGLNSHKCLGSDSGNLRKWVYQIRYPPTPTTTPGCSCPNTGKCKGSAEGKYKVKETTLT